MLYEADPELLGEVLPGEPSFRVEQLRSWLYETPVTTTAAMSNFPAALRERLADRLWPFRVDACQTSSDGATTKWLFRAPDGASIETVLMGYERRATVCISSQAGCAMGCTFCATGQFGFERHLTTGEIVAQVAYAAAAMRAGIVPGGVGGPTNVVFMGMGEPLANYPRVRAAIDRLTGAMGMSARNITVSTVGVVPGMRRLATEPWPVKLAVSLHAADDELRTRLVPLNRRYPLREIIDAAAAYFAAKGRRVSLEWTLIDGVNDGFDQADKLAAIAGELAAHVNLIALNPTPLSPDRPPSGNRVQAFADRVAARGVTVTVRDTKGRDIDAACGQLRVRSAGQTAVLP